MTEDTGFIQIVGIDKGHQRLRALCIACRACLADTPRNAGQNVQLDRCVLDAGDAGLTPFDKLVQDEQMSIYARPSHTSPILSPAQAVARAIHDPHLRLPATQTIALATDLHRDAVARRTGIQRGHCCRPDKGGAE